MGYNNATVKEALKHLHCACVTIAAHYLNNKIENMKTHCDQEEALEFFSPNRQRCGIFKQGSDPMSDTKLINLSRMIVTQAIVLKETCKEWRCMPQD